MCGHREEQVTNLLPCRPYAVDCGGCFVLLHSKGGSIAMLLRLGPKNRDPRHIGHNAGDALYLTNFGPDTTDVAFTA